MDMRGYLRTGTLDGHDSVRMAAPGSRARRASVDLGQLLSCLSLSFLSGASAALPPGAAGGLGGLPRSKPSPCGHQHGARWQETRAHVRPPGRLRAAPRRRPLHQPLLHRHTCPLWPDLRGHPVAENQIPARRATHPSRGQLQPAPQNRPEASAWGVPQGAVLCGPGVPALGRS